ACGCHPSGDTANILGDIPVNEWRTMIVGIIINHPPARGEIQSQLPHGVPLILTCGQVNMAFLTLIDLIVSHIRRDYGGECLTIARYRHIIIALAPCGYRSICILGAGVIGLALPGCTLLDQSDASDKASLKCLDISRRAGSPGLGCH